MVEEALLGQDVHQLPAPTTRDMAAMGVHVRGSKAEGRVAIDYIDEPTEAAAEGRGCFCDQTCAEFEEGWVSEGAPCEAKLEEEGKDRTVGSEGLRAEDVCC